MYVSIYIYIYIYIYTHYFFSISRIPFNFPLCKYSFLVLLNHIFISRNPVMARLEGQHVHN